MAIAADLFVDVLSADGRRPLMWLERKRNRVGVDRFGNPHASDLTYARGEILRSTEDAFQKLQVAWSLIRKRGPDSISIFTGLEQYDPARVRALIATTKQIAGELRPLLGNRLRETPYEACAALSMLLLRDHGMLMVHFVGVPPGTADLLISMPR